MGVLPTMRSDKSEILPYNFKDYYAFIGLEKLSDHPSFRMFNHWHDAVEIIVPIRGHMVYSINGELVHLDENNGVFINSNQIHYGFSADNTDYLFHALCIVDGTFILFFFLTSAAGGTGTALWHPLILCATNSIEKNYVKPITDNAAIPYIRLNREIDWEKTIMDDACELNAQLYAPSAPLALQSLIFKMWKTIFDNTAHEEDDSSHVSPQLSILKDMLSYVHEHYPEKISLNDIANAGKISISSCNTIYKKYLKESPIKHLLNYRLMKSCELLIENALSVTEIAFDVGFANTSYYIDTFKKRYGCTPNEYRKRNKLSEIFTPNPGSIL